MNRMIADTLSILNVIIAVALVAGGAILGARSGSFELMLLGVLLGIISAGLVCGVISYLALIEGHLAKLADQGRESLAEDRRREPTL